MESARVTVSGVLAENANSWWEFVSDWCNNALSYGGGLLALEDIQAAVANRDMQLWVIHNNGILTAVCVTELRQWPRGKALTSIIVGGVGMEEWIGALDSVLTAYAVSHGCKVVDAHGRKGWHKTIGKLGYQMALVTYMKEV